MRDINNRKRKEPDDNFLNITNNKLLSSIISNASNLVSSIIKVEINIDASKTPPPQEQNPLNGIPPGFVNTLTKTPPKKPHKYPDNVVRFKAPGPSSLQSNHVPSSSPPPAQMRRTSSLQSNDGPSSSPPPAQMRRTSSSPPQRTSSSQSKHGASSSQQPNKKQKTNHNPVDSELEKLLIKEEHRIRQASLESENIRKLVESFFYQDEIDVPTNPTIKEISRQKARELKKEEERIKGLEGRYPGASREVLLEVYSKPTRQSEIDAEEQRIKEEILRRIAKINNLERHDSINSFINRNLNIVSKDLVNHVRLYGFNNAIRSEMKTLSRQMTYERVPSNRGGGRY